MRLRLPIPLLALAWAMLACQSPLDPSGTEASVLHLTLRAGGPKVVWDLNHKPLPEIPLPNNQATRLDPTSPTGRRIHVSTAVASRYERRVRERFNKLDGFGAFGGISVRFDAPLDLADIVTRHQSNDDFRDDAVYLLNVDRRCARFGEEVAIDFGRGRFPITLIGRAGRVDDPKAPGGFRVDNGDSKMFPFDPHGETLSLLAAPWNEDSNANGKLDAGEDADGDGHLDVANFVDPHVCDGQKRGTPAHDRCVADHLMGWYERQTNTLTLRPVWPLEERCTYAVVLTSRLRGASGKAVESPFPQVGPRDQANDLQPVPELLARYGLGAADVAFAWTYTVGSMTTDLEALRAGLYGTGPFARLSSEFAARWRLSSRDELRKAGGDPPLGGNAGASPLIGGDCATAAVAAMAGAGDGDKQICGGYADFASVGAIFGGSFPTPDLLVDKDSRATLAYPDTDDELWDIDAATGRATYGTSNVTFWCALPRGSAKPAATSCQPGNPEGKPWCQPYPVAFYAHGYGSFKGEFLLHAGRHNQMGVAACALDSYGHGRSALLDSQCGGHFEYLLAKNQLNAYGAPELVTLMFAGRDRDLNNDGCGDGGADQWTANLFHTRDIVRQSVLEEIQFVRILRAMDGKAKMADGTLAGDIDGDGTVDLGGPHAAIGAWGISLGGQLMGVLAGAEPNLDGVSPNAAGGGLTDISVRLGQGGLAEAVMLPVQGPILAACLPTDGHQNPLQSGENTGVCLPKVSSDGQPDGAKPQKAGELALGWYLHDTAQFRVRAVGRIAGVAVGDRVEVRNLTKGTQVAGTVGARGWLRLNIGADALNPVERRGVLGLKDGDRDAVAFADTPKLGDRIDVRVFGADGKAKGKLDAFAHDVVFQGTRYPKGAPLVALQEGLGYARNTPDFRRFYGFAAHAIAPADPASYADRWFNRPIKANYDPTWRAGRTHVLSMPTVGDVQVPTATGVAMSRAAGLLGSWRRDPAKYKAEHGWRELFTPDARYGVSIEEWLRKNWVIEGDWRMQRWAGYSYNPHVLFDPDDVGDGKTAFSCRPQDDWSADSGESQCPPGYETSTELFGVPHPPAGKALRIDRPRADGSFDSMRIPLLRPAGQHGIYNPQPFRPFDADAFMVNFTARFLHSGGKLVSHAAGCDCSYVGPRPTMSVAGKPAGVGLEGVAVCPTDDTAYGKACSPACAAAWGLPSVPAVVCP